MSLKIEVGDMTMHGLQKWFEKKYEKLGWMTLAAHRGYDDKVKSYLNGIDRLCLEIKAKMARVEEKDRKDECMSMYKKALFLRKTAREVLALPSLKGDIMEGGAKKKGSRKGSRK